MEEELVLEAKMVFLSQISSSSLKSVRLMTRSSAIAFNDQVAVNSVLQAFCGDDSSLSVSDILGV